MGTKVWIRWMVRKEYIIICHSSDSQNMSEWWCNAWWNVTASGGREIPRAMVPQVSSTSGLTRLTSWSLMSLSACTGFPSWSCLRFRSLWLHVFCWSSPMSGGTSAFCMIHFATSLVQFHMQRFNLPICHEGADTMFLLPWRKVLSIHLKSRPIHMQLWESFCLLIFF